MFEKVRLSHLYRESNWVVDSLSNMSIKEYFMILWNVEESIKKKLKPLIYYDKTHSKSINLPNLSNYEEDTSEN